MRIKANVYSRGFRLTTDDPSKNYKANVFRPFDPSIAKEFAEKRSAIQNIVADYATKIADNITDSKSPVTILSGGSLTTPEKALAALTELSNRGLLRADKTIELQKWKQTKEYAKVMQEATDAGATHFREPCAVVKITIYLRDEEEKFVFNTYPDDILKNIDIFRETPLEIAPIYEAAKHCRSLLTDLIAKVGEAKSKAFQDWELEAANSLTSTVSILENLDLHTKEAKTFRSNLEDVLDKVVKKIDEIRTAETYYYYARTKIKELDEFVDVVALSGMDIYEERLTGGKETISTNRKKLNKAIDAELDNMLDV